MNFCGFPCPRSSLQKCFQVSFFLNTKQLSRGMSSTSASKKLFSHPSINQAQPCLASEIRQDRACSGCYGHRPRKHFLPTPKPWTPPASKHMAYLLQTLSYYWIYAFIDEYIDVAISPINESSFSSVQFSGSVVSDSLRPHELQHARPPCPSQTPWVYSNSCQSSQWCHPAISSSGVSFSSCPQSLPASGSFPMSQLFASGGQSIGSFSFSTSPSNEHPGLISFRMDWLDLLAVQRTLKSLLQQSSLGCDLFDFIYFNRRIISLQYCAGFYQTSTWISHRFTHVTSHLNIPAPLSPSHPARLLLNPRLRSLWQGWCSWEPDTEWWGGQEDLIGPFPFLLSACYRAAQLSKEDRKPWETEKGFSWTRGCWFTLQLKVKVLVTQSRPTSCNPMDCSPQGSSVLGIFQRRIPEWVAIPFSRGSSQPGDRNWVSCIADGFFIIWAKSFQSSQPCACLPSSQSLLLWFKEFCRKTRCR